MATGLLLIAVAMGAVLYRFPPPGVGLIVAGGVALVGVLLLSIARYEAVVFLGFLVLGVVKIEPAPPDAVFAIVIAVAAITGRFDLNRVPLIVLAATGAFCALNVLSMIEAINPRSAGLFLSITLYMAVFALWLASFVTNERRARLVVMGYLVAAVVSAALGVVSLLLLFPGSELFVFQNTRATALFKDANVFGPFLVPIALVLMEEVMSPRLLRFGRPLKLALLALLVLGVLFSYSRAAWLNFALGVVVLLGVLMVRRGGAKRAPFVILMVAGAALVAALAISASGSSDFLSERASSHAYDDSRFAAQEAGLELVEKHPAGIGPGQFEQRVYYSAHSTFVRVLTEQGILGAASLVGLFLATLVFAARNVALGRSTFGIGSAALLAAWCGLIANGLFVDTLHWRHLWVVAALIWAGTMAGSIRGPGGTADRATRPSAPAPG